MTTSKVAASAGPPIGALWKRPRVQQEVPYSTATLYRKMKTGEFPRPVRLGSRQVAWRSADVMQWIAERKAA